MNARSVKNRTLPDLLKLKQQVICLYKEGLAVMRIVAATGLSYPTVRKTIDGYVAGDASILPRRRGRRTGDGRLLSAAQEREMRQIISEALPQELGLSGQLWSRTAVDELLTAQCDARLSPRGLDNYLARWGFAMEKGANRHCSQDCSSEMRSGLQAEYQRIARRAKLAQAEIYWLVQKPFGEPEGTDGSAACLLAAVSNRGQVRWLVVSGRQVSPHVCLMFLSGLVRDAARPVFLIGSPQVDCEQALVQAWLRRHADCFELIRYPGCQQSPPDCLLQSSGGALKMP